MSDLKGKEFWDKTALQYASNQTLGRKFVLDPSLFKFIGNIKGKKILDIACGAGSIIIPLAKKGGICSGIDFSKELIKIAQKRTKEENLKIDFRIMDVRKIKGLKSKYFDLIIITLLLPHLSKKTEIRKVLKSAYKLLKPTGKLLIGEPHPCFDFYMRNKLPTGNYNYFKSGLKYSFEMRAGKNLLKSEAYHWTIEDYSSFLKNTGFLIERITEPKFSGKNQLSYEGGRRYPSYIILECQKILT